MLQSQASVPLRLLVGGLFESLPLALAEFDRELRCKWANHSFADLIGLATDDLFGRHLSEFPDPLPSHVRPLFEQARQTAPLPDLELYGEFPGRPGKPTQLVVRIHVLRDEEEEGSVAGFILLASDVKAGEQALLASEQRFRQVVETAPDGMAMVDAKGRIVLANASMETLFGYRRDEMLGHTVEMLMPDRYRSAHGALFSGYMRQPEARDMAGRRELYARRKDGSEFPVEIGLNPISTGDETMALATIQDVTTRKAYRELIEKALAEKTVLLSEIHHRVKNNLQVISSLLNLQARSAGPEVTAALTESQRRVKAMALIHQLLYEHSDFSRVDLGEYVRRLCRLLTESFMEIRHRIQVSFLASDAGLTLDLQRAVPCGLLVNELVTNAIKHAFPDGRHGTVTVAVGRREEGSYQISVMDDGVGIAQELELGKAKSLGFQLIPLLADQAGGSLQLDRSQGTRFDLILGSMDEGGK